MSSTRPKNFQDGFDDFNRRAALCSATAAQPVRQMAISWPDDRLMEPGHGLLTCSDTGRMDCLYDGAGEHVEAKSKYIANIFIDGRVD